VSVPFNSFNSIGVALSTLVAGAAAAYDTSIPIPPPGKDYTPWAKKALFAGAGFGAIGMIVSFLTGVRAGQISGELFVQMFD